MTTRIIFWIIIGSLILGLTIFFLKRSGKSFPWGWVITISLLSLSVWGGRHWWTARAQAKAERNRAARVAASHAPTAPAVVVQKVGMMPTYYKFSDHPGGCVTVPIGTYHFYWYLRGTGKVVVTPPSGASFTDAPGVKISIPQALGNWKFCPAEDTAEGVEVWQ